MYASMKNRSTLRWSLGLALILGLAAPAALAQVVPPAHWDFETEALCGTGCGAVCALLGDWQNSGADDLDWSSDSGGTASSATGPSVDHDPGTAEGIYLYIESSCSGTGYPDKTAELVSPLIDLTGLTAVKLKFWYHLFGATGATMRVDVDVPGDQLYLDVVPPWTDNQDLWQEKVIDLTAFDGLQISIIIRGVTGSSFDSDMAIDDITLSVLPDYDVGVVSLDEPSDGCGLGSSETLTVTVENFGLFDQSGFAIQYILDGDPAVIETFTDNLPAESTASFSFATPADLSLVGIHTIDLATGLAFDEDSSNDGISMPIETIPIFFPPYFEDFEGGEGGWTASGANSTWALGTPAKAVIQGAASGVNAWVTSLDATYAPDELSQVTGPCFDLSALTNPAIELSTWWNSEFSWDGAALQSSTDGGNTWDLVGAFGDPGNWYTDNSINGNPGGQQEGWSGRDSSGNGSGGWVISRHLLDGLAGTTGVILRVAFGSDPSVVDDGFAFDDVWIYDSVVDLVLTKDDGGVDFVAGDTISYTLNGSNAGGLDATGVVLTETVPANTTFNPAASDAWSCVPDTSAGSACTFNLGLVPAYSNGSKIFAVDVDLPLAPGVTLISNTASIADDGANGPDPNPGDNSASESTPRNPDPRDLVVSIDDGVTSIGAGETISYTIGWQNVGANGAPGVVVSDTVPDFTTFNTAASDPGWSCAPNNNPGSLCTNSLGYVFGGENGSVVFAVVTDGSLPGDISFTIDNCVFVFDDGSNGPDPTPGNNTACTSTPTAASVIFADGFESGNPLGWSSSTP